MIYVKHVSGRDPTADLERKLLNEQLSKEVPTNDVTGVNSGMWADYISKFSKESPKHGNAASEKPQDQFRGTASQSVVPECLISLYSIENQTEQSNCLKTHRHVLCEGGSAH